MSTPDTASAVTAPVVKVPMLPLLLCVVAAAVLSVGGSAASMLYLAKSGRLPGGSAASATPAAPKPAEKKAEPITHALVMEPITANLADADGHAYLRVGLTLQIEDDPAAAKEKPKDEKPAKGPSPEEAALRDAALDVLGHAQSADLLSADGKDHLKTALHAKFAASVPKSKVSDIYFTEFLVQR